ncbi:hypothetical protein [uncultured Tateyamaria sp.]|nr:hypothetical protein [uncultured Tateyamaria sp.]
MAEIWVKLTEIVFKGLRDALKNVNIGDRLDRFAAPSAQFQPSA